MSLDIAAISQMTCLPRATKNDVVATGQGEARHSAIMVGVVCGGGGGAGGRG